MCRIGILRKSVFMNLYIYIALILYNNVLFNIVMGL